MVLSVVSLLVWPGLPCLAGESYLDRNLKVHEAVPYGRSAEEPTPRPGGAGADKPAAAAQGAAPSGADEPAPGRDSGAGETGER